MWHRIVWERCTDVSEEPAASIISVDLLWWKEQVPVETSVLDFMASHPKKHHQSLWSPQWEPDISLYIKQMFKKFLCGNPSLNSGVPEVWFWECLISRIYWMSVHVCVGIWWNKPWQLSFPDPGIVCRNWLWHPSVANPDTVPWTRLWQTSIPNPSLLATLIHLPITFGTAVSPLKWKHNCYV